MDTLYGSVTKNQISEYKKRLHTCVHWLLIYKEQDYEFLEERFDSLMKQISGYNTLLGCQVEVLELLSALQAAKNELLSDSYSFACYRKLIFDAHSSVDKLREV